MRPASPSAPPAPAATAAPTPSVPSTAPQLRMRPTADDPFVHEVEVRYAETDQMGVVHHAGYLIYLEDARVVMLRECALPYSEVEASGVGLPVRHVEVRYRNSGLFEDKLLVSVWISRVRAASVTFGYEVHRKGEDGTPGDLLITASVELACMDLETRRARPFPDVLRTFFSGEA